VLRTALARGDRALIADPDGGYLRRFYDLHRGDVILNPFDPRSARWDLFAELRDPYDADQLARALIPDAAESSGPRMACLCPHLPRLRPAHPRRGSISKECEPDCLRNPSSNTLLAPRINAFRERPARPPTALGHSRRAPARTPPTRLPPRVADHRPTTIAELWRRLAIATADELRPLVANTPAQPFLEPENARMFGSIRSVTTAALAGLEHVARQRTGAPFSIRDYVASCRHAAAAEPDPRPPHLCVNVPGAALFMPYAAGQIASLRGFDRHLVAPRDL